MGKLLNWFQGVLSIFISFLVPVLLLFSFGFYFMTRGSIEID